MAVVDVITVFNLEQVLHAGVDGLALLRAVGVVCFIKQIGQRGVVVCGSAAHDRVNHGVAENGIAVRTQQVLHDTLVGTISRPGPLVKVVALVAFVEFQGMVRGHAVFDAMVDSRIWSGSRLGRVVGSVPDPVVKQVDGRVRRRGRRKDVVVIRGAGGRRRLHPARNRRHGGHQRHEQHHPQVARPRRHATGGKRGRAHIHAHTPPGNAPYPVTPRARGPPAPPGRCAPRFRRGSVLQGIHARDTRVYKGMTVHRGLLNGTARTRTSANRAGRARSAACSRHNFVRISAYTREPARIPAVSKRVRGTEIPMEGAGGHVAPCPVALHFSFRRRLLDRTKPSRGPLHPTPRLLDSKSAAATLLRHSDSPSHVGMRLTQE